MNNTQGIKDRASTLQSLCKQNGIEVPRLLSIRIMSQLDGYRSYNVARHGKVHKKTPATGTFSRFSPRLRSGSYLHPDVVGDYIANRGRHCFYCGGTRVYDAGNATYECGWDVLVRCQDCGKQWWNVYHLSKVDGLGITEAQSAQLVADWKQHSGPYYSCPHCNADPDAVECNKMLPAGKTYQYHKCKSCDSEWMEVYELVDVGEDLDDPSL